MVFWWYTGASETVQSRSARRMASSTLGASLTIFEEGSPWNATLRAEKPETTAPILFLLLEVLVRIYSGRLPLCPNLLGLLLLSLLRKLYTYQHSGINIHAGPKQDAWAHIDHILDS